MYIIINGSKTETVEPCTLREFIANNRINTEWCAVALNGGFIPKEQYGEVNLSDGDTIEVLQPAQGG